MIESPGVPWSQTNGNVNYDGIHKQWHSSGIIVCLLPVHEIRDISIWCVSEVTVLTLIMLKLSYVSHITNQFLVVAVCAVPHVCVCVFELCYHMSTFARLTAVTVKLYRHMIVKSILLLHVL